VHKQIKDLAESAMAAKDNNIENYLKAKFNYIIKYGKNMPTSQCLEVIDGTSLCIHKLQMIRKNEVFTPYSMIFFL
jgi:hypothetical protein